MIISLKQRKIKFETLWQIRKVNILNLFGDTGAINFSYYSQFIVNSGKGGGGKGGREGYGRRERKGREAGVLRGWEAGEKCKTLIIVSY